MGNILLKRNIREQVTESAIARQDYISESEKFRSHRRGIHMRRLVTALGVVTLLALPASFALSGSANAVTFGSSITCKKLSGNAFGNVKITGAKCKAKPPHGYGNLGGLASALDGSGTLTWTNTDTLDVTVSNIGSPGQGSCAHGWTEETSDVQVTGSGGDGYDAALVGATEYPSAVCLNNHSDALKLPAHGSFDL
jgi:hypothetical protein